MSGGCQGLGSLVSSGGEYLAASVQWSSGIAVRLAILSEFIAVVYLLRNKMSHKKRVVR